MIKINYYNILIVFVLLGIVITIIKYTEISDLSYALATNPGHSWEQMECSNTFCINGNKVGVGKMSPQVELDVLGVIHVSGKVKVGSSDICDLSSEGSIMYSSGNFYGCNGEEWKILNSYSE